jgi:hypothetical protein
VQSKNSYGRLPPRFSGAILKRRLFFSVMVLFTLALAGCDNCGRFENLNVPSIPKSCHAGPSPG